MATNQQLIGIKENLRGALLDMNSEFGQHWWSDAAAAWVWGIIHGWSDVQIEQLGVLHGWGHEEKQALNGLYLVFDRLGDQLPNFNVIAFGAKQPTTKDRYE